MYNSIERDPRVKADHEAQEQEPSTVKGKRAISNCQVGYWPENIDNGEGSSDIMNDIFLMNQVIDSTDSEKSDSESYNLMPLSRQIQDVVFEITFGVVAKDTVGVAVGTVYCCFRSSDFKVREKFLIFLEVVERALLESPFVRMVLLESGYVLLESPFVRDGVIGIGACAVRAADGVVGIFVR
ncbi:hypothetical protein C2G38_2197484 [Gigaspora rosea]|uniref:Uncharacterized protein n=1 Tax=Gigaspora rosea TaxID=44941 RepID=A0A397UW35_9GLOM|nr:hypothetical protein C2G38_2197484 [Gigaspora rosea]